MLTLANLTNYSITISYSAAGGLCGRSQLKSDTPEEICTLVPLQSEEVRLQRRWNKELLFAASKTTKPQVKSETFLVRIPLVFGASWKLLNVPQDCPWRVYCSQIAKRHHKILVLQKRDMSSFLAQLPDSLPLSALVLPGTHDTMAFYGYPISQCQSPSTPLSTQLLFGIRVLDIRLSIIKGQLIAYHGLYPQRTPFSTILASVYAFLTSPQGIKETIIMSIKQEDFATNSDIKFSRLIKETMMANPGGWQESVGLKDRGMWFLENRIPNLGEVRGKVVLFSRFGGNGAGWEGGLNGMGIHPAVWPDSSKAGFGWKCADTLVQTHDWYNIPSFLSIPEKVALSTRILVPEIPLESSLRAHPTSTSQSPTLAISFLSASSFPLSLPPVIARGFGWPKWGLGVEGVNSRVGRWLLNVLGGNNQEDYHSYSHSCANEHAPPDEKYMMSSGVSDPRIRGWVLADYFDEPESGGLIPLLVECNFRGRKSGEEGWP